MKSLLLLLLTLAPLTIPAGEVITFDSVPEELEVVSKDEPLAAEFSLKKTALYLDRTALTWQKKKKCATCHTNMPYLFARPVIPEVKNSGEVRAFFEDYLKVRWAKRAPTENQGFWTIVVGAGLTFNDLQTTGKLSNVSREVLDLMWTTQRADGGWRWPDCNYAPMELDEHYGATLAAVIVGIAPDDYAGTPAAVEGLENLREFFRNDPPKSLHHRLMIAWCSKRIEGIASDADRATALEELTALQLDDGGWSTAGFLTDWKGLELQEDRPLETKVSDGYGTGFALVIARELGVPTNDPRLKKGVEWIKSNQRESGKWFTRSPVVYADNRLSTAGTAYIILALQACGELPDWPLSNTPTAE